MEGNCSEPLDITSRWTGRINVMARTMKAKVGDVIEFKTPAGMNYTQYTHNGGNMGELVRVLPGLFASRPPEFADLVKQKELYFVFYPLTYSLHNNLVEIVSHQPIPPSAHPYPLMRWAAARDQTGKIVAWKILKASDSLAVEMHKRTPVIRALSPEQLRLSIHQIWPHPVMVRELARGWAPERAEELEMTDIAEAKVSKSNRLESVNVSDQPMRHYLYFPRKSDAEEAGRELRARGFCVTVRRGADGENWLALATHAPPGNDDEMDTLRDELEVLAAKLGGEYDGWELAARSNQTPVPN